MTAEELETLDIAELLSAGDETSLRLFCASTQPVIIADHIASLPPEDTRFVLRHSSPEIRAEVFSHLHPETQLELVDILSRDEMISLFTHLPPDDRADLYKRLPDERTDAILPALAQAEREDIRRLTSYEEGTAGSVMTSDYASVPPDLTAEQSIEYLRTIAPDRETIYYAYVVDQERKLMGFVSLKDLILAPRHRKISEIMRQDVISIAVDADQEKAARKIQKYDLLALPVIDQSEALVGIITHDDAIDVITQEQTEDMEKLMAIGGSHEAGVYMRTSAWGHFRNRSLWVAGLAVLGLASGFIVQNFESFLLQFAIFAAFMPMLADTGGNTGSQSASLVIRALALNEITPRDAFRVILKEVHVGFYLGILLALLAFGRVMLMGAGSTIPEDYLLIQIAVAIAAALGIQVVSATLIGAMLPLVVARFNKDPAVIASPALTTIVDITGLLIYFYTAQFILSI
ncbi:magnesium transporter [Alkalispirochaeta alkalica]|uniref:magnesium transporter n=1 Tax=Alkalispirochaeta alkalica TaxID=46356 RepID=UPI00036696FF|nr:magnesium transporter [Alkalispirochaeta alkalica]